MVDQDGHENEVDQFLKQRFESKIAAIERVDKVHSPSMCLHGGAKHCHYLVAQPHS